MQVPWEFAIAGEVQTGAGGISQEVPDQTAGRVQTGGTQVAPDESGTSGDTQEIDAVVNVLFTAIDFPSASFTVAARLYTCAYNNFAEGVNLKPFVPSAVTSPATEVVPAFNVTVAAVRLLGSSIESVATARDAKVSGAMPVALFDGVTDTNTGPAHCAVAASSAADCETVEVPVFALPFGHVMFDVYVGGGVVSPPPPPQAVRPKIKTTSAVLTTAWR